MKLSSRQTEALKIIRDQSPTFWDMFAGLRYAHQSHKVWHTWRKKQEIAVGIDPGSKREAFLVVKAINREQDGF